jgi:glycosyltransferase involved in cell wall biosynthesis
LIGITRVRNEALVLRDALDYVGKQVDAIVAYDDASTDRTLEISG